jgi:hypothetical protein
MQSKKKTLHCFSGTKTHRLSRSFVSEHRECILLAAGSSLRLRTNKW